MSSFCSPKREMGHAEQVREVVRSRSNTKGWVVGQRKVYI